jgi:hypothetical protein
LLDLVVDPAVPMTQPTARFPGFTEHVRVFLFERVEVMLAGDLLDQALCRIESKLFAHELSS